MVEEQTGVEVITIDKMEVIIIIMGDQRTIIIKVIAHTMQLVIYFYFQELKA